MTPELLHELRVLSTDPAKIIPQSHGLVLISQTLLHQVVRAIEAGQTIDVEAVPKAERRLRAARVAFHGTFEAVRKIERAVEKIAPQVEKLTARKAELEELLAALSSALNGVQS